MRPSAPCSIALHKQAPDPPYYIYCIRSWRAFCFWAPSDIELGQGGETLLAAPPGHA